MFHSVNNIPKQLTPMKNSAQVVAGRSGQRGRFSLRIYSALLSINVINNIISARDALYKPFLSGTYSLSLTYEKKMRKVYVYPPIYFVWARQKCMNESIAQKIE